MVDEFKPGDVVQLRSGGLPMTVTARQDENYAAVLWHTTQGEMRDEAVPVVALTPYVPQPQANLHPTRDDSLVLPGVVTRDNY